MSEMAGSCGANSVDAAWTQRGGRRETMLIRPKPIEDWGNHPVAVALQKRG